MLCLSVNKCQNCRKYIVYSKLAIFIVIEQTKMKNDLKYLCFFLFTAPAFLFGQEIPQIDWNELQKTQPWKASEQWEPVPEKVVPGQFNLPPSDAIVLFDGTNTDQWRKSSLNYGANMEQFEAIIKHRNEDNLGEMEAAGWEVKDGAMVVVPGTGAIETKQGFGDIQLHIEWLSPTDPGKKDQMYSNSGVFLMSMYEIQVLNSYENETYPNGQAGAIYKQHIPLVNASKPSGEWQSYDIVFNAPRFNDNGTVKKKATMTAFHNGVLIQNNVELEGPAIYIGKPYYVKHKDKLPLLLQDHGDRVRFRNIWVREI